MKAMLLNDYNSPLVMENIKDPRPGDDEIILKVRGAGMCYTDIKIVTGQLSKFTKLPLIPGHEIAGDIWEIGKNVKNLKIGQRGVAYPIVSCGSCVYCLSGNENLCINTKRLGFELDGGFSEYVKMPAHNFCPFSKDLPFEQMAILSDAVGTPYHAFKKIARPLVGGPVLILGIGGLGLHAVQLAKAMGSYVIACDVKEESLAAAAGYGADACFNILKTENIVDEVLQLTGGIGVDIVLEGVGKPETVSRALKCLKKQGTLIVMGYNPDTPVMFPLIDIHNNEWKIAGTKICTKADLAEVIALVEKGIVIPKVSETIHLEELNTALNLVQNQKITGRICIV